VVLESTPVQPYLMVFSLANKIIANENLHPDLRSEWQTKKEKAVEELLFIMKKYPNLKPYNFFARSKVPLEWFCLFEDKERNLSFWEGYTDDFMSILYETSLKKAEQRLNRATGIIKKANSVPHFLSELPKLKDLLQKYHPDSRLILDYLEVMEWTLCLRKRRYS